MFEKPMITLYNELEVDGSAYDGDSEYNIPYDKGVTTTEKGIHRS